MVGAAVGIQAFSLGAYFFFLINFVFSCFLFFSLGLFVVLG